jgi:hypothetical protein
MPARRQRACIVADKRALCHYQQWSRRLANRVCSATGGENSACARFLLSL